MKICWADGPIYLSDKKIPSSNFHFSYKYKKTNSSNDDWWKKVQRNEI